MGRHRSPILLAMGLTLAISMPAAPTAAQAPESATLSASQTVRVKLKTSWGVKRAKQLKVKDGAMTCKVTKLV
ncbi:MAG: hypothetical protein MUE31_07885, partial [Candidatus Nanopelagicales bacterium]|nr:hypothetical protein [Candidatus Nanopelagicales bacterium]